MTRLLFATVACSLASCACAQLSVTPSPTPDRNVQRPRWLDQADVVADFTCHVRHSHDTRFIAVYGFTTIVPGTDEVDHARLIRQHGIRYIGGTSDAITSPEHERLNNKAQAYAERYNAMLLAYLQTHKKT
jgi:hypothetical protein